MRQLEFEKVGGWGGKRRGSGRPNRTGSPNHMKRPRVTGKTPVHITLKLKKNVINLRSHEMRREFESCAEAAQEHGLSLNHFAILRDHMHLIGEVASNKALGNGMRSFSGRFSRAIRKITKMKGPVFIGRFHLHILRTPTEMKNALKYLFLNFARHSNLIEHLDEFTSAKYFPDLKRLLGRIRSPLLDDTWERRGPHGLPSFLKPPNSWLARVGWTRGF